MVEFEMPPGDGTTSRIVGVTIYSIAALVFLFFSGWELVDWLRTATWPGRSIATFFPVQWQTGWDGVDVILGNVWRTWIGVPISLLGLLLGWVFISEANQEDQRAAEYRRRHQ